MAYASEQQHESGLRHEGSPFDAITTEAVTSSTAAGGLPHKPPLGMQLATLLVIVVPLLGIIAVPFLVWGWGFYWLDLILLVSMYLLTALGITVGYHRLFTHRSFETYMWLKAILAILGSVALEGPLLKWVAMHRRHHQHSDTPLDPHTPHHHGSGFWGLLKGIWHAHMGWLFLPEPAGWQDYVKDLYKSTTLRWISKLFLVWAVLGLALPALIGGLVQGNWQGAVTGFVWGGLVRVFLVHHVTWSVNSACHLWGWQPFRTDDQSRDNPVFGVLALGEGWHATHHAFPTSARHGLRWWQLDVSYYAIRLLGWLHLAWDIRLPSQERIANALKSTQQGEQANPREETAKQINGQ